MEGAQAKNIEQREGVEERATGEKVGGNVVELVFCDVAVMGEYRRYDRDEGLVPSASNVAPFRFSLLLTSRGTGSSP